MTRTARIALVWFVLVIAILVVDMAMLGHSFASASYFEIGITAGAVILIFAGPKNG